MRAITFLIALAIIADVSAAGFTDIVWDVTLILYSTAAGVAIILIIFHAIKWKLSESSIERMEARKAIINVVLGVALIIIAASLVDLLYKVPEPKTAPMLIGVSTSISPTATQLDFTVMNTLDFDFTNVRAVASSIKYSSCVGTDRSHEGNLGDIAIGGSADYSHDNFCYETTKFDITVFSDQGMWQYCVVCPSEPGGNCNIGTGGC